MSCGACEWLQQQRDEARDELAERVADYQELGRLLAAALHERDQAQQQLAVATARWTQCLDALELAHAAVDGLASRGPSRRPVPLHRRIKAALQQRSGRPRHS